jgi:hypothetical protein
VASINRLHAVRRPWLRSRLAIGLALLAVFAVACGAPSGTARPSASLITLEFTPLPTSAPVTPTPAPVGAAPSLVSWPVGWDISFCTAFSDVSVGHELVIDIERAIADDAKDDAAGLADQLAETTPVAAKEVDGMKEWSEAEDVKADFTALVELQGEVASAYQTYFSEGGRGKLRQARKARNQVAKAVPAINEHLAALVDLGVSCPGVQLQLETF